MQHTELFDAVSVIRDGMRSDRQQRDSVASDRLTQTLITIVDVTAVIDGLELVQMTLYSAHN